jgi:hypothetical protein
MPFFIGKVPLKACPPPPQLLEASYAAGSACSSDAYAISLLYIKQIISAKIKRHYFHDTIYKSSHHKISYTHMLTLQVAMCFDVPHSIIFALTYGLLFFG